MSREFGQPAPIAANGETRKNVSPSQSTRLDKPNGSTASHACRGSDRRVTKQGVGRDTDSLLRIHGVAVGAQVSVAADACEHHNRPTGSGRRIDVRGSRPHLVGVDGFLAVRAFDCGEFDHALQPITQGGDA